MSYLYIPYVSVGGLVQRFQTVNIEYSYAVDPHQKNPFPNFVLVNPDMYYGSYGGLLNHVVLKDIEPDLYLSEPLDEELLLVWWNGFPEHVGDTRALSFRDRVAVTPSMFRRMTANPIRKPKIGKRSSYYADKAWRIHSASTSY